MLKRPEINWSETKQPISKMTVSTALHSTHVHTLFVTEQKKKERPRNATFPFTCKSVCARLGVCGGLYSNMTRCTYSCDHMIHRYSTNDLTDISYSRLSAFKHLVTDFNLDNHFCSCGALYSLQSTCCSLSFANWGLNNISPRFTGQISRRSVLEMTGKHVSGLITRVIN